MPHFIQTSFAGGEVSPAMYGRIDIDRYAISLSKCENAIVHPHGSVSNRQGTYFVSKAPGDGRLIPFVFSSDQSYILEFTDYRLRIIKNGGAVFRPLAGGAEDPVTGLAREWHAAGTGTNVYYLTAASGADPSIVAPDSDGVYQGGGTDGSTATKMAQGDQSGGLDVGEWDYGDFDSLGFDTIYVRLDDGSDPDSGDEYDVCVNAIFASPYALEDLFTLRYCQSADVMYLASRDYSPYKLTRYADGEWRFVVQGLAAIFGGADVRTATAHGFSGTSRTIYYSVTKVADDGSETVLYDYDGVSTLDPDTSVAIDYSWPAGAYVSIAGTCADGDRLRVYKATRNRYVYGFIGEFVANGTTYAFTDDNIDPDMTRSLPVTDAIFTTSGNHPGAVTIYQQRLIYGGTDNNPLIVYGSRTGAFDNFTYHSPAQDDDSFDFTLASLQVNDVKHLFPSSSLLAFTSGNEWAMNGGDRSSITPNSVNAQIQGYQGTGELPPIGIGNAVLHAEKYGSRIRDLSFSLENDGFIGTDLTIYSNHLFDGYSLRDWCYSQHPDSILWAVRNDGKLLGMTYMREQKVLAWHQHEIAQGKNGAQVRSCASIPGADGTEVYLLVQRTTPSDAVEYYVEYLKTRTFDSVLDAHFVDCGYYYSSGSPVTTLSGIDWLEGEAVEVLADGNHVSGLTVTSGSITLPFAASDIHIGLGYTATITTMQLDYQGNEGTVQAQPRAYPQAVFRVSECREFSVAQDDADPAPVMMPYYGDLGGVVESYTGDVLANIPGGFSREGRISIIVDTPVPVTINAIMPGVYDA